MRSMVIVLTLVTLIGGTAWAEEPSAFVDVPPWHWAFDAVQQGAAVGIFTGYPTSDTDLVGNALTQVFDAFTHPTHPAARAWAEWFLTNTPAQWPQPLQRSPLVRFGLEDVRVIVNGDRAMASFVAVATVRTTGGLSTGRSQVEAQAEKDTAGHWRIDYRALSAGQPQLFR